MRIRFFEDNYFDLLSGGKKIVRVLSDHRRGRFTAEAWYSPHTSTLNLQHTAGREKIR